MEMCNVKLLERLLSLVAFYKDKFEIDNALKAKVNEHCKYCDALCQQYANFFFTDNIIEYIQQKDYRKLRIFLLQFHIHTLRSYVASCLNRYKEAIKSVNYWEKEIIQYEESIRAWAFGNRKLCKNDFIKCCVRHFEVIVEYNLQYGLLSDMLECYENLLGEFTEENSQEDRISNSEVEKQIMLEIVKIEAIFKECRLYKVDTNGTSLFHCELNLDRENEFIASKKNELWEIVNALKLQKEKALTIKNQHCFAKCRDMVLGVIDDFGDEIEEVERYKTHVNIEERFSKVCEYLFSMHGVLVGVFFLVSICTAAFVGANHKQCYAQIDCDGMNVFSCFVSAASSYVGCVVQNTGRLISGGGE